MRIIGHLDMDAFFASVEERDNSRFKGRPIAVGADPQGGKGRGVVSTANYKAREYGIKSAMPISEAWRRSEAARKEGKPVVVFLEGNFKKYGEVSNSVVEVLRGYAKHVEPASIDEAYFDISSTKSFEKARDIAKKIKKEIFAKERLTASIGIGPNKLIAKIASDIQKPDGLTVVTRDEAEIFLEKLPVRKIPGIGPKTEGFLKKEGIIIVRDVKKFSRLELVNFFGKWGGEMYDRLRGIDESPLIEEWEAKSIGEQETFEHDLKDATQLSERLLVLAGDVMRRFQKSDFSVFGRVVITVRFAGFETKTKSHTLPEPTADSSLLKFEALRLFMPFLDGRENAKGSAIRLLGVRIEKLL
ncbi:MAG: DNA polymerase IV [Patescibacteria group bacterium]